MQQLCGIELRWRALQMRQVKRLRHLRQTQQRRLAAGVPEPEEQIKHRGGQHTGLTQFAQRGGTMTFGQR